MRNKPEYIILHCSASRDHEAMDWEAIRRFHVDQRGWRDIGYHFGVENVNGRYEVFVGRQPHDSGAHCKENGMNYKSLGICMVGGDSALGFSANYTLPGSQWERTVQLCAELCEEYGIPVENIRAHRDFAPYKTCPGVGVDMDRFRSEVRAAIEVGQPEDEIDQEREINIIREAFERLKLSVSRERLEKIRAMIF